MNSQWLRGADIYIIEPLFMIPLVKDLMSLNAGRGKAEFRVRIVNAKLRLKPL